MANIASSETISFRINAHIADEVKRKSVESGAPSIHFYARDLFLSGLADLTIQDEIRRLKEDVEQLSKEILELRYDLHLLFVRTITVLTDLSTAEAEAVLFSDSTPEDESSSH